MFSKEDFKGRFRQVESYAKDRWGTPSQHQHALVGGNLDDLSWGVPKRTGYELPHIKQRVGQSSGGSSWATHRDSKTDQIVHQTDCESKIILGELDAIEGPLSDISVINRSPRLTAMDLVAMIFTTGFLSGVFLGLMFRLPQ